MKRGAVSRGLVAGVVLLILVVSSVAFYYALSTHPTPLPETTSSAGSTTSTPSSSSQSSTQQPVPCDSTAPVPVQAGPPHTTIDSPYSYTFTLEPSYYETIPVNPYSADISLSFAMNASSKVNLYVLNQSGYEQLGSETTPGQVQAIYHTCGIGASGELALHAQENYYLVVDNSYQTSSAASVVLNYHFTPVDIHVYYNNQTGSLAPTGIGDFGITNSSGILTGYTETASEAIGKATIYSMTADYPANGNSQYNDLLQFNTVIQVNTTAGSRTYWAQNVAGFDTQSMQLEFSSDFGNFSSSGLTGQTGPLAPGNNTVAIPYTLPLSFMLVTNVTYTSQAVVIELGYQVISGSSLGTGVYSTATIPEEGVGVAAILIDGFKVTPNFEYYDTDLVFTGPPYGSATAPLSTGDTMFSTMNATLGIQYLLTNGTSSAPKAVWEFGNTLESAYNLQTTYVNGSFVVTTGTIDLYRVYVLG